MSVTTTTKSHSRLHIDSQWFAKISTLKGASAATIDCNAVTPEDLEYLALLMRLNDRGRKPEPDLVKKKDPVDPWDGVVRTPMHIKAGDLLYRTATGHIVDKDGNFVTDCEVYRAVIGEPVFLPRWRS